jgi:hypothetical protein
MLISTMMEFLNSCQEGKNAPMCLQIDLKNDSNLAA